ncbi:MAG: Gfo/Idh/MocA family oxidoreductase [Saprospiraceae bacterium]|nr:Gfo/Idh/MocA family oxidoreductase [Saprospiraceae bacterium]
MLLPKLEPLEKPVTTIVLGAGNRGTVYGNFALSFADQLDIVGVAEPIKIRRDRFSEKHKIDPAHQFLTWEDVFKKPKFADAIIISTPDRLHYAPCMKALELGYDILLEKPISPSEKECRDILQSVKETGRIVAVCHVLRYAPYFIKLKELMQSGRIGKIVSLQHFEPIEHVHMSHSFVRGNWHNSAETTPIILAKSCHDLDIMRWIIGKPYKNVSAYGNLSWFKKENAPKGSTERCTDGCAVEKTCPYSALRIYSEQKQRIRVFDLPEEASKQDAAILEALRTTNYGRCVYRMDNDQPDHYAMAAEFEENITATFQMEAFTPYHGRRTRIMGSMGFIEGDMDTFTLHDFQTLKSEKVDIKVIDVDGYQKSGHGGGDWQLVADFIQAVAKKDASLLTSTIDQSIESHIVGFMAEESRLTGQKMTVKI